MMFGNLFGTYLWETNILTSFEKAGAGNPGDPINKFFKILTMVSISSRKHELNILKILSM